MNYRDYQLTANNSNFITATHLNQPTLHITYDCNRETRIEAFQEAVDLWLDPIFNQLMQQQLNQIELLSQLSLLPNISQQKSEQN